MSQAVTYWRTSAHCPCASQDSRECLQDAAQRLLVPEVTVPWGRAARSRHMSFQPHSCSYQPARFVFLLKRRQFTDPLCQKTTPATSAASAAGRERVASLGIPAESCSRVWAFGHTVCLYGSFLSPTLLPGVIRSPTVILTSAVLDFPLQKSPSPACALTLRSLRARGQRAPA